MKKSLLLAATAVVGAGVAFQGSVNLQATTPGTPQTGHLNVTGTAKAGVMVGYSSTPTGIAFGGDFRSASTSGRGVLGNASATTGATYGGLFQSFSNAGRGVAGIAQNATGNTYGGFFSSLSVAGFGVYGQATAASGPTYGVYGKAVSPAGFGVYSEGNMSASGVISGNGSGLTNVNASTLGGFGAGAFLMSVPVPLTLNGNQGAPTISGVNAAPASIGVKGQTSGNFGLGLYGYSSGGSAVAVYGETPNGTAQAIHGANTQSVFGDAPYGIVGEVLASDGYGIYSLGKFGASGTKAFRIDHPFDPENKYLLHYSAEGPDVLNMYTGNVHTDEAGYATIELPDYYSEINKDPRYTLTVIDSSADFVLAKVVKEILDNRFTIRTSKPKVKVSWRIDAIRNDAWMRTNGAPIEEIKPARERGKYQHPYLYGKPDSLRVSYVPGRNGGKPQASK